MQLVRSIRLKTSRGWWYSRCAFVFVSNLLGGSMTHADEIAAFYSGKQVSILVGFGVGGGGDSYARLLARHLGDYIPGKPTVIVQNMPGAGGLVAMNYLYNAAPQDGTVIMSMLSPTVLEPLIGNKNARWDANKFHWLGNLTRDFIGCITSGRSGIKSIKEAAHREILFGATGPSANSATHPYALANVLGYKTKVVAGYKGTSEAWLALEKGEVEAVCAFWASQGAVQKKQELDLGTFVPIAQMGPAKHPIFKDAPLVYDLARDEEEKAVMKIIFGPNEISRPFAAPPNIPSAQLKALQKAFWDVAQSSALLAEAETQGLYVDPMTSEATGIAFQAMTSMPAKIFDRAAAATRAP